MTVVDAASPVDPTSEQAQETAAIVATVLDELARRGLVAKGSVFEPLAGNADRHPARIRTHGLVRPLHGPALKLTIARDLAELRKRAVAFGAAVPALCPRELFFEQIGNVQAWGVEAFSGTPAENLDRDTTTATRLLTALQQVEARLDRTSRTASDEEIDAEWKRFVAQVVSLQCWSADERNFVRTLLLPALENRLRQYLRTCRWTSGDFISGNLHVQSDGHPVLFDAEYASATILHSEDRIRFQRVSPICHRHPGLLAGWWGASDPAWETFFQLRQLALEQAENSAAYNATWSIRRRAEIRHFVAEWLDAFPPEWPRTAAPEPIFTGETAQLFWRDDRGAFCEADSMRVTYRSNGRQLLAFRVPGRHRHWRLDPICSRHPVLLRPIVPVPPEAEVTGASLELTFAGAAVERTSSGIRLTPHANDPQVLFSLPDDAIGLVMELETL